MCTVTFIPGGETVYLTSNRDEKAVRPPALPPKPYQCGQSTITYPKDMQAGGTWIAMKDNGDAAVLLNGGFKKHIPTPPYSQSRGLVLLDVIGGAGPVDNFRAVNLFNVEPFTLVLFTSGQLHECRWDGAKKYHTVLDTSKPYIWSSVTLYDEAVVIRRRQWFREWLGKHPYPTQQEILDFHRFGGEGDNHNDLRMNRDGKMLTVSITGIKITNDLAVMRYVDLQTNQIHTSETIVNNNFAVI